MVNLGFLCLFYGLKVIVRSQNMRGNKGYLLLGVLFLGALTAVSAHHDFQDEGEEFSKETDTPLKTEILDVDPWLTSVDEDNGRDDVLRKNGGYHRLRHSNFKNKMEKDGDSDLRGNDLDLDSMVNIFRGRWPGKRPALVYACPSGHNPIRRPTCGSDGHVYFNPTELQCAQSIYPGLRAIRCPWTDDLFSF